MDLGEMQSCVCMEDEAAIFENNKIVTTSTGTCLPHSLALVFLIVLITILTIALVFVHKYYREEREYLKQKLEKSLLAIKDLETDLDNLCEQLPAEVIQELTKKNHVN